VSRAVCLGCWTPLGGSIPAYRWTWLAPGMGPLRPLLCARCCAEWRRHYADTPYTVRSV
jgi:hypothetical protein